MPRLPKRGLEFAGWSVDIFDGDKKIDKLLDAHGWKGFGVYFFLCQRAYKTDGYYYEWGYDDCASTARKMGGGMVSSAVEEIVKFCLQIGLFNQGLFDRWNVLTSAGIQRRFWAVARERRVRTVYKEYWILADAECEGLVKVSLFENKSPTKADLSPTNADMQAHNAHKVKYSKESKESKEEYIPPDGGAPASKDQKYHYGEYKNVLLTDGERDTLFNDYGERETLEAVRYLDEYIEMKGKKYKSHYLVMRNWVFDAVEERRQKKANGQGVRPKIDWSKV